jgi:hypothetical protein
MIAPRKWHREPARSEPVTLKSARGAAPAEPQPQYFLEVSLKLGLESVDEFYRLARTVLKGVQDHTSLTLEMAAASPSRTELLHVWSLPSPDALKEGMVRLADNPAYGQLDRLVLDERQEITSPFGRIPEVRPRPSRGGMYLRVTGNVATRDLAEFQALHEIMPPRLPGSGWELWGALLNITGRLNQIRSIWVIPRPGEIKTGEEFRYLPGVDLMTDVAVERWSPTTYNP